MKIDTTKLVTFRLGLYLFAVDVFSVDRVLRYVAPSPVPDVPVWIDGVMEHRGKVIPVVDMRRRIGFEKGPITAETRLLVLTTPDGWVGTIVDAVQEVAAIPSATIAPPPALFRGLAAEFMTGIARVRERLIVVLDVERVLTSADRIAFGDVLEIANGAEAAVRG